MTRKIAKEWFKANPKSVVTFHRRWDALNIQARERLASPRMATVIGYNVVFSCPYAGRSELALRADTLATVQAGELQLFDGAGHFVSYRGAA